MSSRTGSTTLATILGIGGLLAVGFGSFAAYKTWTGGCGACCAGDTHVAAPAADVAVSEKTDGCCPLSGGKAAVIAASDASAEKAEGCCKDKAKSECCKTTGEGCEKSCEKTCTDKTEAATAEPVAEPAPETNG